MIIPLNIASEDIVAFESRNEKLIGGYTLLFLDEATMLTRVSLKYWTKQYIIGDKQTHLWADVQDYSQVTFVKYFRLQKRVTW